MGCGESKHAVATENTLTKSKSNTKSMEKTNNPPPQKPSNDDANVNNETSEEGNENSTKKEGEKEEKEGVHQESGEAVVVVQEKNIQGDGKNGEELKGELEKEEKAVVVPNESPKKDDVVHEETIESVISDGISGRSDYYSPHAKGHVSEINHDERNDEETKSDKEKEDVIKVDEGKESSSSSPAVGETKTSEEKNISAAGNEEITADAVASTADQVKAI